jgi:dihydrolipoamide dehydrogenase
MVTRPAEAEVLVVGAGPGGYVAAIRSAQRGLDTALVEKEAPGGVCLNHGCIPSKALVDVAGRAHEVSDLPGVTAEVSVDVGELAAWKDGVVDRLTGGVEQLCAANGVSYAEGTARFTDETTVEVDPPDLRADAFAVEFEHAVVATGSRPVEIPGFSFDDDPILDSRAALALSDRPDRLVVVGAGYIGMELSTAFAKLGTEVTVLEALDAPLPSYEDALVEPVRERAAALGIEFRFGERAAEWYQDIAGDAVVATETEGGDREEYPADRVLVAVGREPVSDGLALPAAGVETGEDGAVRTDDLGRTDNDRVYAVGDAACEPMLAHEASHEGLRAVAAVADEEPPAESAVPAVVFTDPEIATVGMAPEAAESAGHEVAVGRMPFAGNGRALTAGDDDGFVRVVADADDGTLLGAQLVGPHVSELVGELSVAVTAGLAAREVAHTVHAHPTLSEAVMEAAANAEGEAIHTTDR